MYTARECHWTVSGENYMGNSQVSKSGKPCVAWDRVQNDTAVWKTVQFQPGMLEEAGSKCRSPITGIDRNGNVMQESSPWCFVHTPANDGTEKYSLHLEHCDIKYCGKDHWIYSQ